MGSPVSVTRSGECNAITKRRCGESALTLPIIPTSPFLDSFRVCVILVHSMKNCAVTPTILNIYSR